MNLVICNQYGQQLASAMERASPLVVLTCHDLSRLAGQARVVDENIPLQKDVFRAWARTRFGKAGVASAVGLDRAAGKIKRNTVGPYPLLEQMANLRRKLRGRTYIGAQRAAGREPGRILRFDNTRLATSLTGDTSVIVLARPDDDTLTHFTDTLTFTRALWGRKIVWLADPHMGPVQSACWREALSGFAEVTELFSTGDVDADARLIVAS